MMVTKQEMRKYSSTISPSWAMIWFSLIRASVITSCQTQSMLRLQTKVLQKNTNVFDNGNAALEQFLIEGQTIVKLVSLLEDVETY